MDLLGSSAMHVALWGGARSGKTLFFLRAVLIRALKEDGSRHLITRFRFNACKTSIVLDTLPTVMRLCFPGLTSKSKLNKEDWYLTLPNGSEIWFGGLDDKERTEKILGHEYATIYFVECSQIPWHAVVLARTRLAQKTQHIPLKFYYDFNPPSKKHWTYVNLIEHRDPITKKPVINEFDFVQLQMNPEDNKENLPASFIEGLKALPEKAYKRFYLGQFSDDTEGALWTVEVLAQNRVLGQQDSLPDFLRVIVAVDPSGTSGPEDTRSNEVGIIVIALGTDSHAYVLEDLSGRYSPKQWGNIAVEAYNRHNADRIIGEKNFGGAMVEAVIRAENAEVPYKDVIASRGKVIRAEPVSSLYEQHRVHHVGYFPELEDQMCCAEGTLVETSAGQIPIEKIKPGDFVMTRAGLAPVKASGRTGKVNSLLVLCTSTSRLEVTPCHPIFVRDKFVSARHVSAMDCLSVSRNWVSMGCPSLGEVDGIIACLRGILGTLKANFSTLPFMRRILAKGRAAITFTTSTMTRAITASRIWNVFLPRNIFGDILLAGFQLSPKSNEPQQPKRDGRGFPGKRIPAFDAEKKQEHDGLEGLENTAHSYVEDVTVKNCESKPVYNLEVEDGYLPEYFANGVLVHNCAMTTAGYQGVLSPDRADGLVHGITELFPSISQPEDQDWRPPAVKSPSRSASRHDRQADRRY